MKGAVATTRWVLTIPTSDGLTVHVLTDTEIEAEDLAMSIWLTTGTMPESDGADIREVPPMWECDGLDGCIP